VEVTIVTKEQGPSPPLVSRLVLWL